MLKEIILVISQDFPLALNHEKKSAHYEHNLQPLVTFFYKNNDYAFVLANQKEEAQWLTYNQQAIISVLYELGTVKKQLEVLGGPSSKPFFSLISNQDRIGQNEESILWARSLTRRKPHGVFLPYGIWEPNFPSLLSSYDLNYSFINEDLFKQAAGANCKLNTPYIIEDMGKQVTAFPYYLLNEEISVKQTVKNLQQRSGANSENSLLTIVLQQGNMAWVEELLVTLATLGAKFVLPSNYLRRNQKISFPRIYLPASSAKQLNSLAKEGFYRNYLFASKEAQLLYAKISYISVIARQAIRDKNFKRLALEEIWKSQNHQFYWASRFGGIKNPVMRDYAYKNLLSSYEIILEAGSEPYGFFTSDFDMDGLNETLYQGVFYNAFTHCKGGLLFELDYLKAKYAALHIYNDRQNRLQRAFHDFILASTVTYDHWLNEELDYGFEQSYYDYSDSKKDSDSVIYSIEKTCDRMPIGLSKQYTFAKEALMVDYALTNRGQSSLKKFFATEINLSTSEQLVINDENLQTILPHSEEYYQKIFIIDEGKKVQIQFEFSKPVRVWHQKLSNEFIEDGETLVRAQGLALLFSMPSNFLPNTEEKLTIKTKLDVK